MTANDTGPLTGEGLPGSVQSTESHSTQRGTRSLPRATDEQQRGQCNDATIDGPAAEIRQTGDAGKVRSGDTENQGQGKLQTLAQSMNFLAPPSGAMSVGVLDGFSKISIQPAQARASQMADATPEDLEDAIAGASARYRQTYAQVMREFRAGSLRGHSGQIVKERYEAKALAAARALKAEGGLA